MGAAFSKPELTCVRSGRSDADQRALDLPRVRSRPQQSGVMQETSNLRASSLYSLAWVRDSDKLPHSARGQHVDVRRMISARLRVPPLWCGVRAGNNTIDSRGLKRAKHAQMPPADPYSRMDPRTCPPRRRWRWRSSGGLRPGPGAGRRMIAGQQGAVQNDSTKFASITADR